MCQAIDDPKIVNLFPWLTVLMGSSESAIIAVEDEIFPFLQHLIRHFARAFIHGDGLLLFDDLP